MVARKEVIVLILTLLLMYAGCKSTPKTDAPRILKAEFLKEEYTANEPIRVNAAVISQHSPAIYYEWTINEGAIQDVTDETLPTSYFSKGDRISCTITAEDSMGRKSKPRTLGPIEIKNSLPVITWADFAQTDSIYKGVDLSIDVETEDVDGDDIDIQYTWYIDNQQVSEDEILDGDLLEAGKRVKVELIPFDGDTTGEVFEITRPIITQNLAPKIVGTPQPVLTDTLITCKINAEDPDGDPITYSIKEGPSGLTIDNTGMIRWKSPALSKDTTYQITVKVTDPTGAGREIKIPLSITRKSP
jgi:hypothetical protein